MAETFVLFYLLMYFKYPEHCLTLFSQWHKRMNARAHICLKGQPQPTLDRSLTRTFGGFSRTFSCRVRMTCHQALRLP